MQLSILAVFEIFGALPAGSHPAATRMITCFSALFNFFPE